MNKVTVEREIYYFSSVISNIWITKNNLEESIQLNYKKIIFILIDKCLTYFVYEEKQLCGSLIEY